MRFITDRKSAEGLGSARAGTHHHWHMMISSALLVVLVPLFVFTFGMALGGDHDDVLDYFSQPWPAIITGLTLIVVTLHCKAEAEEAIVDYIHGVKAKLALVAVTGLAWALIAAGLFALVKLAL